MHRSHRRSPARVIAATTLALCAVLASGSAASATPAPPPAAPDAVTARTDTSDFEIESFVADYRLSRDADDRAQLRVVETITAVFPDFDQNRGIERAIPTTFAKADLGLDIVSVRDEEGYPLPYTTYRDDYDDGFLVVRIGEASRFVHGRQVYVIEYRMHDVVRSYGDTGVDEFYWDVNGTGWRQPFGEVTAHVHVADDITPALTGAAACYFGSYGSDAACAIERDGDGFSTTVRDLGPGGNVTIAIAFEDGTFSAPVLPSESWIVKVAPWLLVGVVVACLAGVLWLRVRVFRDARGQGVIVPQYEGFPGLGVMEAAHLLGKNGRGLPAQVVQLIVTRAARLIDRGDEATENTRYQLELIDTAHLERDDVIAVATMFGTTAQGTKITLNQFDTKLGDRFASLATKTAASVASTYRTKPTHRLTSILRLVLFVNGLAAVGVGIWALDHDAESGFLALQLAGVLVVGFVLFVLAGSPTVLTEEGALAKEHLLGMLEYIKLAEADRLRMLQSPDGALRTVSDAEKGESIVRLYERMLPYAMIWGLEKEWQRILGKAYERTPAEGHDSLRSMDVGAFAATYATAHFAVSPPVAASSSSSSSWSSSGGSSYSGGSSGGGFSGGGGGGGGGGGW